MVTCKTNQQ